MSKEFNSISEAISYHPKCYVCGGKLTPNYTEFSCQANSITATYDSFDCSVNMACKFEIDYGAYATISINTGRVIEIKTDENDYAGSWGSSYITSVPYSIATTSPTLTNAISNRSGTHSFPIEIGCQNCTSKNWWKRFAYSIECTINFSTMMVAKSVLRSEIISIEGKNGLYEVENRYSHGITNYWFRPPHPDPAIANLQRISIPLIPLNLTNPHETIARIKRLSLFL